MTDWIKISSKFANKCKVCLDDIAVGETVLWKKGEGIKHESCKPKLVDDVKAITTPDIWNDTNTYTRNELQFITECQCCGTSLNNLGDVFINADRRVCQSHFLT